MASAADLLVTVEQDQFAELFNKAQEHKYNSTEFAQCLSDRFPRAEDLFDIEVIGPSRFRVRPSEAFRSFMQDL